MAENKSVKTSIGGQALIEGIMMRGPQKTAMAVRSPEKKILIEKWATNTDAVPRFWKIPVFRGVYNMVTSLALGYKCLMRSATMSGLDDEEQGKTDKKGTPAETPEKGDAAIPESEATADMTVEATADTAESPSDLQDGQAAVNEPEKQSDAHDIPDKSEKEKKNNDSKIFAAAGVIGSVLGVVLAIVLFIWLPSFLFELLGPLVFGEGIKANTYGNQIIQSIFEGILKIAVFIGYMAAVSMMPDIKRTFQYHGAEHKTIFCYEKGLPLTVENVKLQRRFHPRCGTSFMIIMLVLGIFIGMFIPKFTFGISFVNSALRAAIRLCLLPLVVGLGYELIKFAGRHDNLFVRIISAPGLWMQRISTKEPDASMIECAIAAMQEVIPGDGSDEW